MKIRSVLLGSLAAVGLSTTGFAADLGVVTSLDICDELGLSGPTISSDDNCLVISGGVEFEYSIGDYSVAGGNPVAVNFWRTGGAKTVADNDGTVDSAVTLSAWLKFVATADSDFGPAQATIKLLLDEWNGNGNANLVVDEAWVGIGDTTMIMAGKKGSIFKQGDDEPLNYLGLFNSSDVDAGVGFSKASTNTSFFGAGAATGGVVIQVVSNLGNGLSVGGGIEDLDSAGNVTAVGVLSYAGDGLTAHVSGAVDRASDWKVHAGFTGAWDPIKVVGAFAANNDANATGGIWWNALGSASATFDMFTLAVSGEATSEGEWGVGGSVSAAVADGVKINLGSRYFNANGAPVDEVWQTEAGVSAAVTETLTLTAAIGLYDSINNGADNFYGKAGLAWAPGGGFTSSIAGEVNSLGAYKATFKAAKDY